jgi:hypothetical protein
MDRRSIAVSIFCIFSLQLLLSIFMFYVTMGYAPITSSVLLTLSKYHWVIFWVISLQLMLFGYLTKKHEGYFSQQRLAVALGKVCIALIVFGVVGSFINGFGSEDIRDEQHLYRRGARWIPCTKAEFESRGLRYLREMVLYWIWVSALMVGALCMPIKNDANAGDGK